MPTFKHPCPYCDNFIDRAVAACPFCGQVDPFSPKRCQNCRRIIEDPAWVVCPGCGQSLVAPPPGAAATGTAAGSSPAPGATPAAAPSSATPAAPPAGATAQGAAQPGNSPAPAAPPPPRPPLNPDAATPVLQSAGACSGCGAPLPAGARFCTICGTVAG
jgi:RNA polymerase subunit RPABC4/transcription elongation factor Spt4